MQYTISILSNYGLHYASAIAPNNAAINIRSQAQTLIYTIFYQRSSNSFRIYNSTTDPIQIYAVKLEFGPEQTLAHQENGAWVLNEIPDYGQELAKCQRFQAPIFENSYLTGVITSDAAGVLISFTTPVPLRGNAKLTNAFTANVRGDVSTVIATLDAGTALNVKGNNVAVVANLTATDPANANKFVQIVPAQNNILDANL
jgi:hypothetical protein